MKYNSKIILNTLAYIRREEKRLVEEYEDTKPQTLWRANVLGELKAIRDIESRLRNYDFEEDTNG